METSRTVPGWNFQQANAFVYDSTNDSLGPYSVKSDFFKKKYSVKSVSTDEATIAIKKIFLGK